MSSIAILNVPNGEHRLYGLKFHQHLSPCQGPLSTPHISTFVPDHLKGR